MLLAKAIPVHPTRSEGRGIVRLSQHIFRVPNKRVEVALQMLVRASQSRHYILAPLNIFFSSLKTPAIGRILDDVVNIADLVGEFDLLCPVR